MRIAVDDAGSASASNGLGPLRQILSAEGLVRIGEDGRPAPSLAEHWAVTKGGHALEISLHRNVRFHDGSPFDAHSAVTALEAALPKYMGPAFSSITHITALDDTRLEIGFTHASPFLLEALDAFIQKPGAAGIGTGPYIPVGASAPNEMRANPDYYLGRAAIDRVVVSPYPNVRAAWADMLRDRADMLYEVGTDALPSLTAARTVSVFTYVRHYQYVLIFNTRSNAFRSSEVRRALNEAIDRRAFVQEAFEGHAIPSSGLVWPQNWANGSNVSLPPFDPRHSASVLSKSGGKAGLRFTCLVRPGLDQLALALKRQIEAVGAEMTVREASLDFILQTLGKGDFEAVLAEVISGPDLFRPYEWWHSNGSVSPGGLGSLQLDRALDRIVDATNDDEYRLAVAALQTALIDDPPAIFLAWPERARAVNRRFDVHAEPGRDILTSMRLWRPTNALEYANRN